MENSPGVRNLKEVRSTGDQFLRDGILQPFQSAADRWLGHAEKLRRAGDPALINHDHERAKQIPIQLPRKALLVGLHHKINL